MRLLFSYRPFALPSELSRLPQVWLESRPTSGGDLHGLQRRERKSRGLRKDGFPRHRFVGESKWLLVKL
ncbi:MAG: hypothetical protein DME68_09105 [Verrucomicrobia bacterium]|nr:MAG: hypothetical protein DME68_09105 [Verrucomicrobiota bacterium]